MEAVSVESQCRISTEPQEQEDVLGDSLFSDPNHLVELSGAGNVVDFVLPDVGTDCRARNLPVLSTGSGSDVYRTESHTETMHQLRLEIRRLKWQVR
jgi:hypothetical protein